MNDQNPNPPGGLPQPSGATPGTPAPPLIPGAAALAAQPTGLMPPRADAIIEQSPISGVVGAIEAILRQPHRVMFQLKQPKPGGLIGSLLGITVVCSLIYGLVVGTFSGATRFGPRRSKLRRA